ncbi:MAG: hypothetical protein HYZ50_14565 [Deltaproteobacteria bacterium]|nr:hypothetical protein [Deltaproteobacteria bacterium]
MLLSNSSRLRPTLCLNVSVLLLLGFLCSASVAAHAQGLTFQRLDTKKLWITEVSQFFNLSDERLALSHMGNKAEGFFVGSFDLATGQMIKDKIRRIGSHYGQPYEQILPDVSGDHLVYLGYKLTTLGWDVYAYRFKTKTELRLTETPTIPKYAVAISGNLVVWVERPSPTKPFEIRTYDLATGVARLVHTTTQEPRTLDVAGNWIAWADARYDTSGRKFDTDVFVFDLARNKEQRISNGPPLTSAHSPSLSGDLLVWADGKNNALGAQGKTNIFLEDLLTGHQSQLTRGEHEAKGAIAGTKVVYRDYGSLRTDDWVLLDLVSEKETGVLPVGSSAYTMKLNSHEIVYVDIGKPGARGGYYRAPLP